MKSNPFAQFAAGNKIGALSILHTSNDDGWMTTRKTGRDDTAIRRAANEAAEARKAKNRRTTAGAAKRAGESRRQEMSHSGSEEGDWNSDLEEDDESVVRKSKAARGKKKPVKVTSKGKRTRGKKVVYEVDVSEDEVDQSMDDIYEEIDDSPEVKPKKKLTQSKYFSQKSNDSETDIEEKKEEDDVINVAANHRNRANNRKRRVFEDSSDEEEVGSGSATISEKNVLINGQDDFVKDTPTKPNNGFSSDDFISDDEEAIAMAAAVKASMKDERKRLKKKKMKKIKSSLERLAMAPPAKKAKKQSKVVYLDDMEEEDDGEISVASHASDDAEQKTAAQVLNEANALSAKIVKIVSQWCEGEGQAENLTSKGLILGEGALSLGGGGFTQLTQAEDDNQWISKETMKKIMPRVELAEYQLLGVNWMALLNRLTFMKGGKRGKDGKMNVSGILADEMGLGKTVQTIAFLAWLNYQNGGNLPSTEGAAAENAICVDDGHSTRKNESLNIDETLDSGQNEKPASSARRPHLIVVPASVLTNWMNEFKKFAPHMVVIKYHGSQKERIDIQNEMRRYLPNDRTPANAHLDVVLTTFSYFSSEKGEDRLFLRKFRFDYLVVDEGHTLKNPKGLRYRNLNKFPTSHRLLLTGTPVQNSPKELMSLLCFLMPLFDSKTKSSKSKSFDSDDEQGSDGGERMLEHFVHLEAGDGSDAAAYRKLKQLFAPFVLRRKKSDVLSQIMPPKTRQVDLVDMDEVTSSVYNTILSNHVKRGTEAKGKSKEFTAVASMSAQKHLFTELRKAANHPLLLRTRCLDENDVDDLSRRLLNYHYFGNDATCTLQLVKNQLEKLSDYDIHCAALTMIEENPCRREFLERYTLMESDLFCSPKFVRLRGLLPELVEKGHRILLFSQWTRVLDLMHNLLELLDMKFLRLDGQTDVSDRQALVDQFTSDPTIPVFLLSTRAGGMGLNLTAADVCILHDLDFNPFNDRQAEDRCHRIGQKKPVTIIKLVTRGTVDEDIYSLQERKERMNKAIMDESGTKKSSDNDDIKDIMKVAVDRFLKSPPEKVIPLSEAMPEKVETISVDD
ncbi:hypothetical protein HJC23_006830 [Cyclotella cryptica]|uniref:Uncharacterized protein n=1 Tax=Cyclotella cryptica TaxID=29204 RepID=A0ABD3PG11_9STRA